MNGKEKRGIGLRFAWSGLKIAWKQERNFRFHILIAVIVIGSCIYFRLSVMEWALILLMIHIVLITELLNSITERLIDYLNPVYHPQAKIIKDIAAGTVLISAVSSIIIGCLIFLPKLF